MSTTLPKLTVRNFKGFTKLEPNAKIVTMDFLNSAKEVVSIFGKSIKGGFVLDINY